MDRRILAVGLLGTVEALLRLFFYYEAVFAGVPLLSPMPPASTMQAVNSINLILGLAGLLVIAGLMLTKRWGYWGTIAVSVVTIGFDGVSSATVSYTAFAGLVLPVLFLAILLPARSRYFSSGLGAGRES